MKKLFLLVLVYVLFIGCSRQVTQQTTVNVVKIPTATTPSAPPSTSAPPATVDIGVSNLTLISTDFTVGYLVKVEAILNNNGGRVSGVNVALYDNGNLLNESSYDLNVGEQKTLLYNWYPKSSGDHTIKIVVDPENKFNDVSKANTAQISFPIGK